MNDSHQLALVRYAHIRESLWELADEVWQKSLWTHSVPYYSTFSELLNKLFTDENAYEFIRTDAKAVGLGIAETVALQALLSRLDTFAREVGVTPELSKLWQMPEWHDICMQALTVLRTLDTVLDRICQQN